MKWPIAILSVLLLVPSWSTEPKTPDWSGDTVLTATPVALDSDDPARRRVGGLTFLGGWRLTSRDPAFGGISSMLVEGDRFTLLSDYALVSRFRFDGRTIRDARFTALPGSFGAGWAKPDFDSESLAHDPASGRFWVGFEGWNAIARYAPDLSRRESAVRPLPMRKWPANGGPESVARLADGGFVVIGETAHGPHGLGRRALRFFGDPTLPGARGFGFVYLPPAHCDPSDAVQLPDGRLLVLNRRFQLPFVFTAILTVVDTRAIRPGARVTGREIARFAAPLLHDNFEALSIVREGDDTILWMASDDNQLSLQRSLLLKFRIDAAR